MRSSLIRINIGDIVSYDGQPVEVKDVVLTPNGAENMSLVALVYAKRPNGNIVTATSNRFEPCDEEEYEGFWPTPHMSKFE